VALIKAESTGGGADLSNVRRLLDESFWLEGDSNGGPRYHGLQHSELSPRR
jgi:hypothetical protein